MSSGPRGVPPQRFRLPVRQPLRELLIASLCATIGSFEVIAWATFRLGWPLLLAGVVLIVVGAGFAAWCLFRYWRTRWRLKLDAEALTVHRGSRERRLAWSDVGEVRVVGSRVEIFDTRQRKQLSLGVDRTPRAHEALRVMLEAIELRRGAA